VFEEILSLIGFFKKTLTAARNHHALLQPLVIGLEAA